MGGRSVSENRGASGDSGVDSGVGRMWEAGAPEGILGGGEFYGIRPYLPCHRGCRKSEGWEKKRIDGKAKKD